MRTVTTFALLSTLTLGAAVGCDETVSKEQETEVRDDGSTVTKTETVKKDDDGSMKKEETYEKTPATKPAD